MELTTTPERKQMAEERDAAVAMTERQPVCLYFQAEAVLESARRANSALTDAMIIWSEGDWRLQQCKKRFEHLAAAAETLKKLFEADVRANPGEKVKERRHPTEGRELA